jgi:polysaccharide biosynthesis protein PslJ
VTVMTGPQAGVTAPPRRIDAATLLTGYLFLLMAIPSSLVVGSFGAAGAPAALYAVVLLCCYLVARQHPAFEVDKGRQPVRTAAVLFGCATIAAYVSANRRTMPVAQMNGADRGIILLAGWLAVLLLAADGIDRPDRLRAVLRRVVTGATAMAVLGIAEFFTGVDATKYIVIPGLTVHTQFTDLMSRDGLVRVTATAAQPLEFAAVLAMSLPLAVHQARFAPRALRVRRWLQVALIGAAMPMTVSRSAIFGIVVVGVVLIPTWPKRDRRRAYLLLLATPVLVWLLDPRLLSSFGGLFGQIGTDSSATSRTGAYSSAVPFIVHHPWLGQGFQTFFPQIYFFVDDQYLTSLIETGVIGAVALLALLVTGWLTARSARLATADPQSRDLAQCLAASVAAAAVSFATFDALSFSIASGLCFLLLGCTGAAWRLAGGQARPGLGRRTARQDSAG